MIQETKQLHTLEGIVARQSGQKSVMVTVTRLVRHPRYQKVLRQVTRLRAHDEGSKCRQGDLVEIQSCRPLSRTKRWRVIKIIKTALLVGVEVNA